MTDLGEGLTAGFATGTGLELIDGCAPVAVAGFVDRGEGEGLDLTVVAAAGLGDEAMGEALGLKGLGDTLSEGLGLFGLGEVGMEVCSKPRLDAVALLSVWCADVVCKVT